MRKEEGRSQREERGMTERVRDGEEEFGKRSVL